MASARRRPPAQEQMLGMITGYWVSQMIFVAAQLGIADLLAARPATAEALAKRARVNAPYLRRLLRGLGSVGIFAEDGKGRFRLTPLAQTLRGDRPGSLRDFARMAVAGHHYQAWGGLDQGLATGRTPFDAVHGMPIFDYLRGHPEDERVFATAMASISATENAAIARAYPFGSMRTLVDVGGAHGHLVTTILRRHRKLRGVLYDQPAVVAAAARSGFIRAADVRTRCEAVGGSFFDSVPSGADGYIMKYILHDWDDEKSLQILGNCRAALPRAGRLLVVEHVIPAGNAANWGKLLDINMMAVTGGQERTRDEFRDLVARAGLRLKRVIPTACPLSIVEVVRA
jgi:hypothetical protein